MQEIVDYIHAARAEGSSEELIKQNLKSAGWDDTAIANAVRAAVNGPATPETPPPPAPAAQTAIPLRDKFLQLWKAYRKYALIGIVVVGVFIGGYYAYSYYASRPERVWANSLKKMATIKSGHFKLETVYNDKYSKDEKKTSSSGLDFLSGMGELGVTLSGEGSFVMSKDSQPDYDVNSKAKFKLGSFSVEVEGQSKKIGDAVYYKISGNPLMAMLGSMGSGDTTNTEWMKIDLKKIKNDDSLKNFTDAQTNELAKAFNAAKLMKPSKLIGEEKIGGVSTWHYQAELDKTGIRDFFNKVMQVTKNEDNAQVVNAILDKLEMKKLEMWIGKYDSRLYQVEIDSNAPSVFSYATAQTASASDKSRDAKRLADVRQITTALELFYNDNARYPASAEGKPSTTDGTPTLSSYLSKYPESPTPADGNCTSSSNSYNYTQTENGAAYELTFCLGGAAGGFGAGTHKATLSGIDSGSANFVTTVPTQEEKNKEIIGRITAMTFSASITIKMNFSDYDKSVSIDEPKDALDYNQLQNNQTEVSNINNLRYALDSYYFDNTLYPASLSDLKQTRKSGYYQNDAPYLKDVPQPQIRTGDCASISDDYNYKTTDDGKSYTFDFCLTQDSRDLKKGKHYVDTSGIH